MRQFHPEEVFEPDRVEAFEVPAYAEGIRATAGWDGATRSYYFLMMRSSVDHLGGAFDKYLNKPVEVGDAYFVGGRLSQAPIEIEPDMRDSINTLTELIHWTWDEIDWRAASPRVLMKLRDAPMHEQMITIRDEMEGPKTIAVMNWVSQTFFAYGSHVDHQE